MTQVAEPVSDALRRANDLLAGAQRIAILAHVNPDADAIGTLVGLTRGLKALGKDAVAILNDPVPRYAQFLPGSEDIVATVPPGHFDVFFFVDSADIARVGAPYETDPARFQSAPILNLDHHRTNPGYGTVNYVDPHASSSAELSYRLLCSLGAPIDPGTATALLFGVVGDTGSFQNGATTPGSLEMAAGLVRLGADNQRVAFQLFEWKTFAAARLWGRILSTIQLDRQRKIVFAFLTQQMLREEQATVDEAEGLAEFLRGVEEADVVMVLRETETDEVRVSMRSRPAVDVSAIATALNGGGHRQAAGCTIAGSFEDARSALIAAYDRLIKTA